MIDLKEDAGKAIFNTIKKVSKQFFEKPYYLLYESDIQCEFYRVLVENYGHEINLKKNDSNYLISNAIHSEPIIDGIDAKKSPDFLIYHTDEPVDMIFEKSRKIHFPPKANQSRSIIEIKLNRSPIKISSNYRNSFKNDLNKTNYYHADHFYFLFFDRSLKIDDLKYVKFANHIKNKTMENKSMEVIYIGADIKNPGNGLIRRYIDGKFESI